MCESVCVYEREREREIQTERQIKRKRQIKREKERETELLLDGIVSEGEMTLGWGRLD